MFSELLTEYDLRRVELQNKQTTARKELANLTKPLTQNIISSIESAVALIHDNQRKIEKEAKEFKQESTKLAKMSKKWVDMYDSLNNSMKELGDIVNWAGMIERDMSKVSETIEQLVLDERANN